jgi:hypothetical protein
MTDFQKRIVELETKASGFKLIADLAIDPSGPSSKPDRLPTCGSRAVPLLMWIKVSDPRGCTVDSPSSVREFEMSAIEKSETISRRKALSLVGLAAAFGFAAPAVLAVSSAEAQTTGMERRQDRRTGRHDRRDDRRTGRTERRENRRTGTATGAAPSGTTTGATK